MFGLILPASVRVAETGHLVAEPHPCPSEVAAVAGAAPRRRAHFLTGRRCARSALLALEATGGAVPGRARGPLGRRPDGSPRWPAGVVGSLTHCDVLAAAAVARASQVAAIGIDAEPDLPLHPGVVELVATVAERRRASSSSWAPVNWDRALWCAKEAVVKAACGLTGIPPDLAAIEVTFDRAGFVAVLNPFARVPGPHLAARTWTGRWSAHGGVLRTAVVRPARGA